MENRFWTEQRIFESCDAIKCSEDYPARISTRHTNQSPAVVQRTQQLLPNCPLITQTSSTRRTTARIVIALLVLMVADATLKSYIVQETIVGLLFVAITVTTVFTLTVAFVLFQEGIRRTLSRGKNGFASLGRLTPHHNGSHNPMIPGADQSAEECAQYGPTLLVEHDLKMQPGKEDL